MLMKKILFMFLAVLVGSLYGCGFSISDPPENGGSTGGGSSNSEVEDEKKEPEVISVSQDGELLLWQYTEAEVCIVKINGEEHVCTENQFELDGLCAGVYVAVVEVYKSVGEAMTARGECEVAIRLSPTSARINGSLLQWQAVDGASGYEVYLDGALILSTAETQASVSQSGAYTVVATHADARLNSQPSEVVYLADEADGITLTIEGGIIKWNEYLGARFYLVLIEGKQAAMLEAGVTELDVSNIYKEKFAEDYPDGITVSVCARTEEGLSSPSNEVKYIP